MGVRGAMINGGGWVKCIYCNELMLSGPVTVVDVESPTVPGNLRLRTVVTVELAGL